MQTVISVFDDYQTAQRAVEHLVDAGFDRDDVHVQQGGSIQGAGATTTSTSYTSDEEDRGVLSSIGHFFASLFGQDNPSGHSGTYAEAVKRGSSVVVVDAQDEQQAERASNLMHELGAVDVDERSRAWRQEGWTGYRSDLAPGTQRELTDQDMHDTRTGEEGVMDVVQEELQVGKRSVDRGGVRVIQRVSQKPVRELIRLREEHAVVDRRPVDRPATAEDLSNFREGTIEVREMSEEAVVGKTARVVEEVRVGKDVREREETIEDNVRRKDVDIERIEGQGSRAMETDRAFAADRNAEPPLTSRDPDAPRSTTNKPGRNS